MGETRSKWSHGPALVGCPQLPDPSRQHAPRTSQPQQLTRCRCHLCAGDGILLPGIGAYVCAATGNLMVNGDATTSAEIALAVSARSRDARRRYGSELAERVARFVHAAITGELVLGGQR